MKNQRRSLFSLVLAVASLAIGSPLRAEDRVLARVGKVEIRQSELDAVWDRIEPETRKHFEAQGGKAAFLLELAAKRRIVIDAERKGIDQNPGVKADIELARESILVERWIEAVIAPEVIPDNELRAAYTLRLEKYRTPLRLRCRHILVTSKADEKTANRNFDDAKTPEEAKTKIEFLAQRLKDGADFITLAQEYSEDAGTAPKGGELGYFGKGTMVKAFEDAALALKPGQVSEVVETVNGFHLIRLEERQDEGSLPFEKVAPELRRELLGDKMAEVSKKIGEKSRALESDLPIEIVDPTAKASASAR